MTNSICLNMIVKNEAHVIQRCLNSVRLFITSWCIVDTGSTDGTQKVIADSLSDLPGQLHERPWKDFGYNRTEAIQLAKGQGEYLLFIDADDQLLAPSGYALPRLTDGAYQVRIELDNTEYWRPVIVAQSLPWRYVGALHEYLECATPHVASRLPQLKIVCGSDGGRSMGMSLIEKYKSDAALLERALQEDPGNSRNVFYLAQSYRDSEQSRKSLDCYRRRATMGGWDEEVWYSKFQVARLSERLALEPNLVLTRYLEAYEFRPTRAEALVELARYCREKKWFHLACLFAEKATTISMPADILFVEAAAYAWRGLDELSVAAYWTNDFAKSAQLCRRLLGSGDVPEPHRERIAANLQFSEEKLGVRPAASSPVEIASLPDAIPPLDAAVSLESILEFNGVVQIADIGAAFIAEVPPYKALLDRGIGFLSAFEADRRHQDKIKEAFGDKVRVFPDIVGDGREATLRLASPASGMSSLLEPHEENLAFFNQFSNFGKVFSAEKVQTSRLDDIAELADLDFIKMDIQGSEMAVLRNGSDKLKDCVGIHLEISFVPLYRDQPCFGEVDIWMRQNGFLPHAMTDLKRWSISPIIRSGNFRVPFNQLLEGDIVYLRDPISAKSLSAEKIKKMALIAHYAYGSPDMVAHLLEILVTRKVVPVEALQQYLKLSMPRSLAVSFFSSGTTGQI